MIVSVAQKAKAKTELHPSSNPTVPPQRPQPRRSSGTPVANRTREWGTLYIGIAHKIQNGKRAGLPVPPILQLNSRLASISTSFWGAQMRLFLIYMLLCAGVVTPGNAACAGSVAGRIKSPELSIGQAVNGSLTNGC